MGRAMACRLISSRLESPKCNCLEFKETDNPGQPRLIVLEYNLELGSYTLQVIPTLNNLILPVVRIHSEPVQRIQSMRPIE